MNSTPPIEPKPAPAAFLKIREKEREEEENNRLRLQAFHDKKIADENSFFERYEYALKPYHGSILDGHPINVINRAGKRNTLDFYVNGILWLTFTLKWDHSSCSCEGLCTHKATAWLTRDIYQHKVGETIVQVYFPCEHEKIYDEEKFAEAMIVMMNEFRVHWGPELPRYEN